MRDEKTALRGEDVREVFEAILPEDALRQIITEAKFEERNRKPDALAFVRAMVISASTGYGGRQLFADYLFHLGHDPNWRSRPSVLDQMRGWRISPGRPRQAKIL